MLSEGVMANVFMCNSIPPNNGKIQSADKDGGVSKAATAAAQVEILSSSSIKPFTLYHASKRLTFTTALQLRACNRLKCGGWKKKTLKSLSGSTWLTDVKIVVKRKATAAISHKATNRFQKRHKDFFFSSSDN